MMELVLAERTIEDEAVDQPGPETHPDLLSGEVRFLDEGCSVRVSAMMVYKAGDASRRRVERSGVQSEHDPAETACFNAYLGRFNPQRRIMCRVVGGERGLSPMVLVPTTERAMRFHSLGTESVDMRDAAESYRAWELFLQDEELWNLVKGHPDPVVRESFVYYLYFTIPQ